MLCALVVAASGDEASDRRADLRRRGQEAWARAAEIAERFQAETFVTTAGDTMPYRFLAPESYDPSQKYPLVVCLHGGAGRGRDNVRNIGGCTPAQVLSELNMRTRYPSFLLVPQAPPEGSWGSSIDEPTAADRIRKGRPTGDGVRQSVIDLIQIVVDRWSVDPDRIYLTGQSMGGGGSWHLAIGHPDLFAALMPITGVVSTCYADSLAHMPVWAFHGELDDRVPAQSTRDMVAAIDAAGGTARYTEFEGIGHGCWRLVFDDSDALDWLFEQRRREGL